MSDTQNDYRERKYRDDTVFNLINKKYITLQDEDRKVNNEHLKTVIEKIFVPLMQEDKLFDLMYRRIMYGGSYYKGTKYGKPEEFDLDLVIKLPVDYKYIIIDTNHNNYGYVKIKINLPANESLSENWVKHSVTLSKWLTKDNNYLDQNEFYNWMKNIFETALSKIKNGNKYIMEYEKKIYTVKPKMSGPAFTISIETPEKHVIDVDLVPCLEFDDTPLNNGYKLYNRNKTSWMVVAKPLKIPNYNIFWRLCFYEQEKDFLRGEIKPVIRMLKKFRDTLGWEKTICSYYIETIFYHELENYKNDLDGFLRAPRTLLFMLGLKKLRDALIKKELPYFWHSKYNLFDTIKNTELQTYANYINKMIERIDSSIERDGFILADEVLGKTESEKLRKEEALSQDMSKLHV